MTIHSPRFLLVCCRFSEEKNKVHLKRKECSFVQVFPSPNTKKNECSSNHMCSEGNWKQNAFYEVQFSSDAKWSLCILWCGEIAKVDGVGKRAEPRTTSKPWSYSICSKTDTPIHKAFQHAVSKAVPALCGPWDGILRNQCFWVYPPDFKTFIS